MKSGAVGSAVLGWADVGGYAAATTGQVLQGVEMKTKCYLL